MAVESVRQIYERHIKLLPASEKLQLLALVARELADQAGDQLTTSSIMELHGLGKEIWDSIEPQDYVSQLRAEWDTRHDDAG